MPALKVILSQQAHEDVQGIIRYLSEETGAETALLFIENLEAATNHMSPYPDSGSLRYAEALDLSDVGHWMMADFPYLLFYEVRPDDLFIWRILHAKQDITAQLP